MISASSFIFTLRKLQCLRAGYSVRSKSLPPAMHDVVLHKVNMSTWVQQYLL